jgi:hypothetical protein
MAFQFAAQDGGVKGAGGCSLVTGRVCCVPASDLAAGDHDQYGDQNPARPEEPPLH